MNNRRKKNMSNDELIEWIKSKLIRGKNGCMEWSGARHPKGYGNITIQNKTIKLHRFVLEQKLHRRLDENMCACHTCNNPPCCNPDHLYEGTNQDNVNDKVRAGRQARGPDHGSRGITNPMSKLTESQIRYIREQRGRKLQIEIAKELGISRTHVSAIQLNRLWRHVK